MDNSHTHRGAPTVHRALAARSDAAQLGVNTAIVIGDLALAWSDEILHTAGLTSAQLAHVLPVVDRMRAEITRGQYLDLLATGQPGPDTGKALDIARCKTAKYTVERPLHIGATPAGAGGAALDALSAYALPTGEAFHSPMPPSPGTPRTSPGDHQEACIGDSPAAFPSGIKRKQEGPRPSGPEQDSKRKPRR